MPGLGVAASGSAPAWREVTADELVQAMHSTRGYDRKATTNTVRFQAEVMLWLIRRAQQQDPQARPLFIDHGVWFRAYLAVNGISERASPQFSRLAYEHKQDLLVDYRREHVLRQEPEGRRPRIAANVTLWWPKTRGAAKSFSLRDMTSNPQLDVTCKRVVKLRLLDFGDMVVADEVRGLRGRPTSGALGFMFKVIGKGRVAWARFILTNDGLQVARIVARKGPIALGVTGTVFPDGRISKGIPRGRSDLAPLGPKLKRALKIRYCPF